MREEVFVISAGRPGNVPAMERIAPGSTWVVPAAETRAYLDAGATAVMEDGGGLIAARNRALEVAFSHGAPCVQLSDDLRKLEQALGPKETRPLPFSEALDLMRQACRAAGARLSGIAPVANAFYFNPARPFNTAAFILGDFMYVLPSEPRFDAGLRLKEDYDFTLQHLVAHRAVARCNGILGHFAHRTNKGGACAYRTAGLEQAAIGYLKAKWPGYIKDNPRRPNEILLSLR
jgi:hypothetical protein